MINHVVIASNRLPVVAGKRQDGRWRWEPGQGGLVTALAPVLRDRGGLWIGWAGNLEEANLAELLAIAGRAVGYALRPVSLTQDEVQKYYFGFSNEIVWPLFHDLQSRCNFNPDYWNMYQAVNRKFAQAIAENAGANDYVWVQDYHLMLVARELRSMGLANRIGFFLHTPFPPPDIYVKLPWRSQLLSALLEYDLLGFQTRRDRNNFINCVEALIKGVRVYARKQIATIAVSERETTVGTFPISIDFRGFGRQALDSAVVKVASGLREALGNRQIILGVDRLDYTKGIPEKLRAFRAALQCYEDLRGRVSLVQIVVPSRVDIPEYQALRSEIEGLVGEINGEFTEAGWVPINYIFRSVKRSELLAFYRAADVALITPLKDGMNLIAKEYCAANTDKRGVLVLSEFAGAATQLRRNALIVNPYDIDGVAAAIYRAYSMGGEERELRMRRLRKTVAKRDIFWWVDSFLRTATGESGG